MKSDLPPGKLNFEELTIRLRAFIRHRINSGDYTERGLARALRVSQPHLHNVLKGARRLNVQLANQLMIGFSITILDLITDEELREYLDKKNPQWRALNSARKPAAIALDRESLTRFFLREPKIGD